MPQVTIHDSANRPWGIETLVTIVDNDGEIFNFSLCNKTVADANILETQALEMVGKQKQVLAEDMLQSEDIVTLEAQKQSLIEDIQILEAQKESLTTAVK